MNETIKTLVERASPRSFRPEHIEKEKLDQIILAGLKAPSGRNAQTPIFIAVTNDDMVKKLSKLNADVMGTDADPFYGAPDVVAVLVRKEFCWSYDGSIALGNMLNAAWSLGVGSRWIHRAKEIFADEEGKKILADLGITDDVEGVGFCVLGYTDENPQPKEITGKRVYYIE